MAVLVRFVIIVVCLSSAVGLGARGRSRGYQAGGGIQRAQPTKAPARKAKEKTKKPSPPPERESAHSTN